MKTIGKSLLGSLLVGALALAALVTLWPAGPAHAQDMKAFFAEVKKLDKAGEDGKAIAKLLAVEDNLDPVVTKELATLASKAKTDKVAVHCMRMVAKRKDPSFLKKLPKMIGNKKLYKDEDKEGRYIGVLKAAAMYESPKLSKPLYDIVKKFLPSKKAYSTNAIRAYGTVRDTKIVDQLITWLDQTSATGGGGGAKTSTETTNNYRSAKAAIIETLASLTGLDISDAKTWKETWAKKGKTFKFPDPNAAEVDITTLREYLDNSYGFHVALTDRKMTLARDKGKDDAELFVWNFVEMENAREGARCRASARDDTDYEVVRVTFLMHNATRGDFRTPQALYDWWAENCTEGYYSELSKTPESKKKKMGGRQWIVGTARGQSGGKFKGWGVCERRIYITEADHMMLYLDVIIRGVDEATANEADALLESVTFPDS